MIDEAKIKEAITTVIEAIGENPGRYGMGGMALQVRPSKDGPQIHAYYGENCPVKPPRLKRVFPWDETCMWAHMPRREFSD